MGLKRDTFNSKFTSDSNTLIVTDGIYGVFAFDVSKRNTWGNQNPADLNTYIKAYFYDSAALRSIQIQTYDGSQYAYISASKKGIYKIDITSHLEWTPALKYNMKYNLKAIYQVE